jgi:type I restriction enzyme S subunit
VSKLDLKIDKVSLREVVFKTTGGGTPERANPDYWNGGIPWATVKDFKDNVHKLDSTEESISGKGLKFSASNLIPAGTPIICTRMAVGRIAHAKFPVAINQDLRALFIRDDFDVGYIIWAIDLIRHKIDNLAIGSTVKGINVEQLLNFEIYNLTKPEQTRIAEVLSTVDRAIEQTKGLIAKQQRIKTGLMQDLLTRGIDEHGNLRSEQTHPFKDSPLGRIPVEWEVMKLGTALQKAKGFLQTGPFGSQLHAHEYVHDGIPVIMPQDILNGIVSIDIINRVPECRASDLRKHRVQIDDVIFSRRGDLSKAAAIGESEIGWLCGTGCFLLRVPSDAMDSRWLVNVYRHHYVQRQNEANAVGSTMPSLNNTVMEQLVIAFPTIDEQRAITRRHNALDLTIQMLNNHNLKLRSLKTALMQDLIAGKVRVTPLLNNTETGL